MKRTKRQESASEKVIRKAREAIVRYRMIEPAEKVLAAVSGGADSVALLYILLALRQELGFSVHIVHLNHGIRGKAADEDEEFVRDLAGRLDLPLTTERADVPMVRRDRKLGLEEAARQVRYAFLERVASKIGAARIATGHTADDRVETFLLNLARGSSARGLCALAPLRGDVIRPLIRVWRWEIEAYLAEIGQQFREDESNRDLRFARNKVRWVTLPFLEERYPGISERMADLCEIMAPEQDLLDQLASKWFESALVSRGVGEVTLSASRLLEHPPAAQRLILRRAVGEVMGDLVNVGLRETERILDRLAGGEDFGLTLPSGRVSVLRRGDQLCIGCSPIAIPNLLYEMPLAVPGRVEIAGLGVVSAQEWDPHDFVRAPRSPEVVIDAGQVAGDLVVRNWRYGDRMTPLGMRQERKLQDIFTDAKVPASKRMTIPIVTDSEKIVWAAGLAVSEAVKVRTSTKRAIRLSLTR